MSELLLAYQRGHSLLLDRNLSLKRMTFRSIQLRQIVRWLAVSFHGEVSDWTHQTNKHNPFDFQEAAKSSHLTELFSSKLMFLRYVHVSVRCWACSWQGFSIFKLKRHSRADLETTFASFKSVTSTRNQINASDTWKNLVYAGISKDDYDYV